MLVLRWNSRKLTFFSKFVAVSLLLLVGCPTGSSEPVVQDLRQPTGNIYQLDTINAYMADPQVEMAKWLNRHPDVDVISVSSAHGNGFLLVIYKTGPRYR